MDNMDGNSSQDFSNFTEIVRDNQIWYKCTLCTNTEFKTKGHRKYHQYKWHDKHKPKPFNCATCGAGFIVKSHYSYHLGTHTKEKPYKCPTCKKGFLSRSKLNRHVRIHTGKVFQCQHCEKKFATAASRKQHEKIHSSKKPLKRGNNRRKNSKKQASSSKGPSFPCTTCDKEFKYAKDLKRHALVHTGERKFICLICKEKHQRKDNLTRHIRKVHDQTEESARVFVYEEEADAKPRGSPVSTSESSEEDTDVEMEESSSDDGSSTTSESTDSDSETSTEDDDDDVEMANGKDEKRSEIFKAISNEGVTAEVDAISIVADSMGMYMPPSPEPMTISDDDDHFKADEAVAEVIFNKDALVITRVTAKMDDDKIETDAALDEIALNVVPNEEIKDNVEDIVDNGAQSQRNEIAFQEEPVNNHINDHIYTSPEKAIHNDHSYAFIESLTETEDSNDSNLEATAAIESLENEGEIPNDYYGVGQSASSCEGEAHFYDAAENDDEMVTQLLFSLKEMPSSQHDLEIYDTSVNDIVHTAYLERKRITKEFLSFMYSEDACDKENEPTGNIMLIDEFGVSREMEAGGILTLARDKLLHIEPLLIQKIILYSSSPEPIFCTIQDTIIVNQQQQNDTVELHYWSTAENDNAMENFDQEDDFNESNSIKEEVISNGENNWNSAFPLDALETTMNAMESNYAVLELVDHDIHSNGEYQCNLDAGIVNQESTGNSSCNASESHGDYYGEPLQQSDLLMNGGSIENQDYYGDFHVNPEPSTGSVPASVEECPEKDTDNQVEGKVKLIQIPKKRQTSWHMNEHN